MTPELFADILNRLTHGVILSRVLKELEIDQQLFWTFCHKTEENTKLYLRARYLQMQAWGEQIIDIAEDSTRDTWMVDRLRIDTRKFLMAKIAPKIFGENINVSGGLEHHVIIDMPTRETRLQWEERKKLELSSGCTSNVIEHVDDDNEMTDK